jgi:hypothetical protein
MFIIQEGIPISDRDYYQPAKLGSKQQAGSSQLKALLRKLRSERLL